MPVQLNIPEGVSPHLVQELQRIQDQILVLIANHEILHERARENPENASRIDRQICAVEKFLLQFNQEQQPILAQVRQEIKDKGLVVKPLEPWRKESSRAKGAPESSWSQDADSKDVVGVDKAAPSSSSASLSARMAQVRDSKKKRKRKAGTGASAAATPGQTTAPVTRTPTPDPSEGGVGGGSAPETEEERLRRQEEEGNLGLPLVGEGQVRAHLSQVEKKSYEEKVQPVRPEDLPAFPFVLRNALFSPKKSALSDEDKFNYMLHLGLIRSGIGIDSDDHAFQQYRSAVKEMTRNYRNLTYIPEFNEKKQRLGYSWLAADQMNSPPMLRKRRRIGGLDAANIQQLVLDRPRTRRKKVLDSRSNSNSRASTPVPKAKEEPVEDEEEEEEEDEDDEEEEEGDQADEGNEEEEDPEDEDEDSNGGGEGVGPMAAASMGLAQDEFEREVEGEEGGDVPNAATTVTPTTTTSKRLRVRGPPPNVTDIRDMMERDEAEEETVAPHAPVVHSCVDDAVVAALPPQDEVEEYFPPPPAASAAPSSSSPATRSASSDKQKARMAKVKASCEQQLQEMLPRLRALQEELDVKDGKFTIATRKERTRRNELQQERATLEEKAERLRATIEEYEEKL